jgi:hypothetical protein
MRIAATLLALTLSSPAATTYVFLAGGQSNAYVWWANAIESTLQGIAGPGVGISVVSMEHGGAGMSTWFNAGNPGANYTADLAAIQAEMNSITTGGNTAVFAGVFWMQGESDAAAGAGTIALWDDRFLGMMARYQADLGLASPIPFTLGITDGNHDPAYDNLAARGGATWENIDLLRATQMAVGGESYVDSRGYTRQDGWHLTGASLNAFGAAAANTFSQSYGFVPEPSATLLAGLGALSLIRRERAIRGPVKPTST